MRTIGIITLTCAALGIVNLTAGHTDMAVDNLIGLGVIWFGFVIYWLYKERD